MRQKGLFDAAETAPYQRHSRTSRKAAKAIEPLLGRLQRRILEYLRFRGERGATDLEMEKDLAIVGSTVRPRRGELVAKGYAKDSGKERPTPSGRSATVWIATSKEGGMG